MQQRNVLGDELIPCSMDPLTGYYRTGCCENRGDDPGMHVVCCRVTEEFLEFSVSHGNDLVDADAAVRLPRAPQPATSGASARRGGPKRWRPGWPARSCSRAPTCRPSSSSISTTSGPTPCTERGRQRPSRLAPAGRVGRGDLVGGHPQRRLGDRVDERPAARRSGAGCWRRPRRAGGGARRARPAARRRGSPRS